MAKIYKTAAEAVKDVIKDGMLIHAGGFGLCGIPENIIAAIAKSGVKALDPISGGYMLVTADYANEMAKGIYNKAKSSLPKA